VTQLQLPSEHTHHVDLVLRRFEGIRTVDFLCPTIIKFSLGVQIEP